MLRIVKRAVMILIDTNIVINILRVVQFIEFKYKQINLLG